MKAFAKDQLLNSSERLYNLLINEIRVMRNLSHTNIMNLLEVYETEKSIYLILDLYTGKNLNDHLESTSKLNESEVAIIMKGIIEGLIYLKSQKVMHRDIKPQNILFRNKDKLIKPENIIIVDFGLAQIEDDPIYIYTRCGTPGYVAPEILKSKDKNSKYTCACDVFSTGILFHLMLVKIYFYNLNK